MVLFARDPVTFAIPPEQVATVKVMAEMNLLNDQNEYLTRVRSPLPIAVILW